MPLETQVAVEERSGVELIRIPGGDFRMGSEEDEDARPVHRVRLKPFRLGRTEVTREQYARFMSATGRPQPGHWEHELFKRPGSPVIGVTWADAAAFCAWAGGRLPTEAEWEFAARGPEGRRFPWGSQPPAKSLAHYHLDIGFAGTQPAGQLPAGATPQGVLEMAGNAFEWCADWYDPGYYAVSPVDSPPGPAAGKHRVIRGGAWISLPDACRAAARSHFPPEKHSVLIGFRLAQTWGT